MGWDLRSFPTSATLEFCTIKGFPLSLIPISLECFPRGVGSVSILPYLNKQDGKPDGILGESLPRCSSPPWNACPNFPDQCIFIHCALKVSRTQIPHSRADSLILSVPKIHLREFSHPRTQISHSRGNSLILMLLKALCRSLFPSQDTDPTFPGRFPDFKVSGILPRARPLQGGPGAAFPGIPA